MAILSLFIGVLIGGATVIFALQNTAEMSLTFLTWTITAPTAFFVVASFAIGIILAFLALLPRLLSSELEMRAVRREKRAIESVAKANVEAQKMPIAERTYA